MSSTSSIQVVKEGAKVDTSKGVLVEKAGPNGESLTISPCKTLPPRGVLCKDFNKPMLVHPFWLVDRVPLAENPNMVLSVAEGMTMLQVAVKFPEGIVNTLKDSGTSLTMQHCPVLINDIEIEAGTKLVMDVAAKGKVEKTAKVDRWDRQAALQEKTESLAKKAKTA